MRKKKLKGFTLVEMMVSMTVGSILLVCVTALLLLVMYSAYPNDDSLKRYYSAMELKAKIKEETDEYSGFETFDGNGFSSAKFTVEEDENGYFYFKTSGFDKYLSIMNTSSDYVLVLDKDSKQTFKSLSGVAVESIQTASGYVDSIEIVFSYGGSSTLSLIVSDAAMAQ